MLSLNVKIINQICNGEEPFWEDLHDNYINLTNITYLHSQAKGVEGNIYNFAYEPVAYTPSRQFLPKRQTFAMFAAANDNIVEIGFNAGHSALLALTANPNLKFTAIDIGWHPYVEPCFDFLRSRFGDRIDLIIGDSKEVIPNLYALKPELKDNVEGWIIDGNHNLEDAAADLENVYAIAKNGDRLVFDDTDFIDLGLMLKFYQMKGMINPLTDLPESHGHLIFDIRK